MKTYKTLFIIIFILFTLINSKTYSFASDKDEFIVAEGAFNDGLYQFAATKFRTFIKKYSQSEYLPQAYLLYGKCNFYLKNYRKCIDILSKLQKFFPGKFEPEPTFWIARAYFEKSDYKNAIRYFKIIEQKYSRTQYDAPSIYTLGWIYYQIGEFEKAMKYFKELIKKHPDFKNIELAYFNIGRCLFDLKSYETSYNAFDIFLKKFPSSSYKGNALFWMGECKYCMGLWDEAISLYKRVLEEGSSNEIKACAMYSLGWSYSKIKKHKQALHYFLAFKQTNVKRDLYPVVDFKIGEAYFYLKKYEDAIRTFSLLLHHPKYGEKAHFWIAESLYRMKNYKEAIKFYRIVSKNKNTSLYFEALLGEGMCLLHLQEYDKAKSILNYIAERNAPIEVKVEALIAIGNIYYNQGEYNKAIEEYLKILKKYGNQIKKDRLYYTLGNTYLTINDHKNARKYYKKIIDLFPVGNYSIKAREKLAWSLFREGKYKEARREYTLIINNSDVSPLERQQALYQRAMSYFNEKKYDEALKDFRTILIKWKNTPLKVDVLLGIARSYKLMKNSQEALIWYHKIIEGNKNYCNIIDQIYLEIGNYYMELKRFIDAKVYFSRLINEYPDSKYIAEAYYYRGKASFAIGEYDEALKDWEKVISQFSKSEFYEHSMLEVINLYLIQGKYKEALKKCVLFEKKIKTPSLKAEIYLNEGKIYQAMEDWRNAIKSFERVVKESRIFRAEAKFYIGLSYYRLREYNKAINHFLDVVYLYPSQRELRKQSALKAIKAFIKLKRYKEAQTLLQKIFPKSTDSKVKVLRETIKRLRESYYR